MHFCGQTLPQSAYMVSLGCQIADTLDHMDELPGAVEWLERLLSRVPNDPGVLTRLGSLHARYGRLPAGLAQGRLPVACCRFCRLGWTLVPPDN